MLWAWLEAVTTQWEVGAWVFRWPYAMGATGQYNVRLTGEVPQCTPSIPEFFPPNSVITNVLLQMNVHLEVIMNQILASIITICMYNML